MSDPSEPQGPDAGSDRPRPSTILTTTAAAFAVGAVAMNATYALPLVVLGAIGVTVAVIRRRRVLLRFGVPLGLLGVLGHGALGGGALGTVAAAGLFLFAWDQTDHAFDLDAQLGPDARVVRGELVHAAYSGAVVGVAAGGAVVLAFLGGHNRPLPALVLLLLGALLLTAALRER